LRCTVAGLRINLLDKICVACSFDYIDQDTRNIKKTNDNTLYIKVHSWSNIT